MESEIPGGIPGVFPFVRHRENIGIVQVHPFTVAAPLAFGRWRQLAGIAIEPLRHVVIEELLAPDHSREGLTLDVTNVSVGNILLQLGVELIRFATALGHDAIELSKGSLR